MTIVCEKELMTFRDGTYMLTEHVLTDEGATLHAGSLVEVVDGQEAAFQGVDGGRGVYVADKGTLPLKKITTMADWERARAAVIMRTGMMRGPSCPVDDTSNQKTGKS